LYKTNIQNSNIFNDSLGVPHTVIFVLNHRNCRTRINESLAQEAQTKADYDKTIRETEAAYTKILESSQTLLHVLRRETAALEQQNNCVT